MMTKIVLTLALVTMISVSPAFATSIAVEVDGAIKLNNAISYTSSGIDLEHVSADLESISMIFQVSVSDSVEEGDLTVTFARDIFDAKIADVDDEFFIIADGDEIKFEEEKDDESRTLSFSIPSGTEEFEIFGTILFDESFLLQLEAIKEAKAQADYEEKKHFYEVIIPQMEASVERINEKIADEKAEEAAEELANKVLKSPPLATRAAVKLTRRQWVQTGAEADMQMLPLKLHLTEDFKEASQSFIEKRSPEYQAK